MPNSLCTFTPLTFSPVNLGAGDCFITSSRSPLGDTYKVTCFYIDESGQKVAVSGAQRATAEVYIRNLASSLKMTSVYERNGPTGRILIPRDSAISGTLANPYTGLSVDKCYCVSVEHEDDGNRFYAFTATFVQPAFDITVSPFNQSDIVFGSTRIGDVGGRWTQRVDSSFIYYDVEANYRGANMHTYLGTLADNLGLATVFADPMPRGTAGNRGSIRAPIEVPNTLAWSSKSATVSGAWLMGDLAAEMADDGLLDLKATFAVSR